MTFKGRGDLSSAAFSHAIFNQLSLSLNPLLGERGNQSDGQLFHTASLSTG
ncbi:hypothetical protein PghCCS26_06770 [Paenibacillus glycanilyticus]|uniref:Uncharacterized protein n=1 Tax=Paenibacillus glycanilyticus TaxID=126569 RepID=A0ABQ6NEM8_9BACL|nr:hypothetical protein PghCCS26_06770 [Paenibacillus glycanilyticus]